MISYEKKVVVVQMHLPAYRVPFFSMLAERLAAENIELEVVVPSPEAIKNARLDDAAIEAGTGWLSTVKFRGISLLGRHFSWSTPGESFRSASLVIVPLQASYPDTYRAFLWSLFSRRKSVAVWGHVGAYTRKSSGVDLYLERLMMRSSALTFAYTSGGAKLAQRAGVAADSAVAVQNSVDLRGLLAHLGSVKCQIAELRDRYQLTEEGAVAFIGGLDSTKRVSFLATVLDRLWSMGSRVRCLVGGAGPDVSFLADSVERGQTVILGRVDHTLKAEMLTVSNLLVIPGRVGLVAVEALASGVPILTMREAWHAPEIEYLKEGESVFYRSSIDGFVDFILYDRGRLPLVPPDSWEYPTIDGMVDSFDRSIKSVLSG